MIFLLDYTVKLHNRSHIGISHNFQHDPYVNSFSKPDIGEGSCAEFPTSGIPPTPIPVLY